MARSARGVGARGHAATLSSTRDAPWGSTFATSASRPVRLCRLCRGSRFRRWAGHFGSRRVLPPTRPDGCLADCDRQFLVRPHGDRHRVCGPAGPDVPVGVRQRAHLRRQASHLSLVSSGADASVAMTNDQLIAVAHEEVTAACPGPRRQPLVAPSCARSARRSRWRPANRRVRRRDAGARVLSRRRLDRYGPAGHDRRRRRKRSSRGRGCWPRSRARAPARTAPARTARTVNEVRHRPLPGARAQGPQPPVVRGPTEAQSESGHGRTGRLAHSHADGTHRDRPRARSATGKTWPRPARDRVRRGQFLPGRPRVLGSRRARPAILADLGNRAPASFRVAARRSDKRYPIPSPEIERTLGARIKGDRGWAVNLDAPD